MFYANIAAAAIDASREYKRFPDEDRWYDRQAVRVALVIGPTDTDPDSVISHVWDTWGY